MVVSQLVCLADGLIGCLFIWLVGLVWSLFSSVIQVKQFLLSSINHLTFLSFGTINWEYLLLKKFTILCLCMLYGGDTLAICVCRGLLTTLCMKSVFSFHLYMGSMFGTQYIRSSSKGLYILRNLNLLYSLNFKIKFVWNFFI